ncbi:MAG: tRNA (uridine(34)/cytosine(34)/5-carboxymethylaminomethyluridine(34)-2'-O)-methyltransferase TrmL [Desulfotomaculaceae bacterium]|nr:tRNA (uridine(34)/cytosine(34)/5-carboxymethylaminomethyluridine(34)-2'-O)-methyltransferase TrmL [Desulfotomaculaceae bacterium]
MNIVLVEPEIPANTGNIARTCAVTGASLHLIKPLGFSTEDKYLKRAGLDYWHLVDVIYHDSFADFTGRYKKGRFYFATTKASLIYTEVSYETDGFLIFGRETRGLPPEIMNVYSGTKIRVPMISEARSLNLANSVAVVLYEALRQQGFPGLR